MRQIEVVTVTDDGIITTHPCKVHWVQFETGSGGAGVADLVDGQDSIGVNRLNFTLPASTSKEYSYKPACPFHGGVFAVMGDNCVSITVCLSIGEDTE